MPKLNDTQLVILSAAAQREGGAVLPPPKRLKVKGAALTNVLKGLLHRGLVTEQTAPPDAPAWRECDDGQRFMLTVSPDGLDAIGVEPESGDAASTAANEPKPKCRRNTTPKKTDGRKKQTTSATKQRTSKQDAIVRLLQRPKGASIGDLQAATGWQPHSVRAALTGLRKKGHAVTRSKANNVTRYRITGNAIDAKS